MKTTGIEPFDSQIYYVRGWKTVQTVVLKELLSKDDLSNRTPTQNRMDFGREELLWKKHVTNVMTMD